MNKLKYMSSVAAISILLSLQAQSEELIKDLNFHNGIRLLGTVDGNSNGIGNICTAGYSCNPSWRLAEWYSDMSLIGNNGGTSWGNPYKAVTVFNKGFRLAVNGASENYTGEHGCPTAQVNWPSLLMEQIINKPLSSMSQLNLKFTATLEYFNKQTSNNCYASQMTFYFLVKNKMTGNSTWFGIPFFDNRYPKFNEGRSEEPDGQTGLYIYKMGVSNPIRVNGSGNIINNRFNFNEDILATMVRILGDAGFTQENTIIESFNIGWENPSNNIATMKIENLSLTTDSSSGGGTGEDKIYGFNSNGNTQGWRSNHLTDVYGGPTGGKWYFACNSNDPMLFSPKLSGVNGSVQRKVKITMANDHNPAAYSYIKLYWKGKNDSNFSESRSAYQRINNDGGWRTYTLYPQWSGEISEIRIDPISSGDGHWIGVDSIQITR